MQRGKRKVPLHRRMLVSNAPTLASNETDAAASKGGRRRLYWVPPALWPPAAQPTPTLQSPFVGGSQPLDSGILYSRYTDLSAVLMEGEEVPAPTVTPLYGAGRIEKDKERRSVKKQKRKQEAEEGSEQAEAAANGHATAATGGEDPVAAIVQKPRKKPRWTDEQKVAAKLERDAERAAAAAARKAKRQVLAGGSDAAEPAAGSMAEAGADAADGGADATEEAGGEEPAADGEKSGKKKKKKAATMTQKLAPEERVSGPGNTEEAQRMRHALGFAAAAPEAPAPAPMAAGKVAFTFGFAGGAAAQQALAAKPAPASAPKEAESSDGSSDEEEEEEDINEEEEAEAAPIKKSASSSSDTDSDEDSSDDEDSASVPAAAPAAAAKEEEEGSSSDSSSSDSDSDSSSSDSDDEGPSQQAAAQREGEFVPLRVYVGGMPYGYSEGQIWEYWGYCGDIESLDMMTFPDTGRFRGIVFITFKTDEGYQAALACNGEQCDGQTLKVMKCRPSAKDRQQQQQQRQAPAPASVPQRYALPEQYERAPAAAAEQPWQQQQQQQQAERPALQQQRPEPQQQEGVAGTVDGAPPRKQHSGPAPKTPGYHVAYVGNLAYEADDKALARLFEPCGVTKVRLHTDKDTGKPKGFAHVHFREEAGLDQAVALDGTSLLGRRIRVGYAQPKKENPQAQRR